MLWYVMAWYGLLVLSILNIKILTPSLKNDWVMAVWNIWYLVCIGILWYGIIWYGLLVLSGSITMQNFGLLAWKMTELWLFEISGIWYDLVLYGMVRYSMAWYGLLVLCKSTTMENFRLLAWKMTELWLFEIFGIWYDLVFYSMVW